MKPLAKFVGAALLGAFVLLAAPAAQAQVGVNINIGAPAWGPQVPYGTQYYYIPEIDGYYDLYSQQYIVFQDGYWVPLPQLYGYDPYQFHPVVIPYRGREPWIQRDYYHQRYAYQPYRAYAPSRGSYYGNGNYGNYNNGYGRPGYPAGGYNNGRGYGDHDRDDRGYGNRGQYMGGGDRDHDNRGQYSGGYSPQRGGQMQVPQPAPQRAQPGYNQQGGRGNERGGFGQGEGGGRRRQD